MKKYSLVFLAFFLVSMSAFGASEIKLKYKPLRLPFEVGVGTDGKSVSIEAGLVLPVGEFSAEYRYAFDETRTARIKASSVDGTESKTIEPTDDLLVIRREGVVQVFKLRDTKNFLLQYEGKIKIEVKDHSVYIDLEKTPAQIPNYVDLGNGNYRVTGKGLERYIWLPAEAKFVTMLLQKRGQLVDGSSWYYLSNSTSKEQFLSLFCEGLAEAKSQNLRVFLAFDDGSNKWVNQPAIRYGKTSGTVSPLNADEYWHPTQKRTYFAWELVDF